MFKIFKRKTELEKLNNQYAKLMKESYDLSRVNRKASDKKVAEAENILEKINKIGK